MLSSHCSPRCFIADFPKGAISTDPTNPFLEPSDFIDPLVDGNACTRDLPFLQQLGVNTIRVYSVDSTQNHDSCMSTFSGAGIYTMCVTFFPYESSELSLL